VFATESRIDTIQYSYSSVLYSIALYCAVQCSSVFLFLFLLFNSFTSSHSFLLAPSILHIPFFMLQIAEDNTWKIAQFEKEFSRNPNYYDLTWRLDVEVARRNARNVFDPKYMLRLDLLSSHENQNQFQNLDQDQNHIEENENENEKRNKISENNDEFSQQNTVGFRGEIERKVESYHLQSDFANLKKMEEEIQLALNSLNVTNSQNRIDYNS
jgi:hypothetical protein